MLNEQFAKQSQICGLATGLCCRRHPPGDGRRRGVGVELLHPRNWSMLIPSSLLYVEDLGRTALGDRPGRSGWMDALWQTDE